MVTFYVYPGGGFDRGITELGFRYQDIFQVIYVNAFEAGVRAAFSIGQPITIEMAEV